MKVLITGKYGLLGNALRNITTTHKTIFIGRQDCDLMYIHQVDNILNYYKPDAIIHTAAKVNGIGGNAKYPADIFFDSLQINNNILRCSQQHDVKKLLMISSVAAFDGNLPFIKEWYLHEKEPYPAEYSYGYTKRMIDIGIQALEQQYGTKNYCSVISTNLFGENDSYNTEDGHVIPSLIHKMYLAKKNNTSIEVWGDGSSKREFLFASDFAQILFDLLEIDLPKRIIVSKNEEKSIKQVVDALVEIIDFKGEVVYQKDKLSGQRSRITDLTVLNDLIKPKYTEFKEALKISYDWFVNNYDKARK